MDYGKYKYQESKKQHEAKLKQKQIQIKEVKFRPGTDDNDYQVKLRNLIRFLEEGDKAKMTLRFRGREMAHQEFGMQLLKRVEGDLAEHGRRRAVSQAGRAPDDHGAGPEEEEVILFLRGGCAGLENPPMRRQVPSGCSSVPVGGRQAHRRNRS
jgi:hypothetical protein